MRVYISADYEGICGIVSWSQQRVYSLESRRLMTQEVNAAVKGAIAGGASEVVVNDAHDSMCNLIPEEIHPEAKFILGRSKPSLMMEGLEKGFDLVFLVGYHAAGGIGTGVLSHSYSSSCISEIRINGQLCGEATVNAGFAGSLGIPVGLVTGDEVLAREATAWPTPPKIAQVKESIGRYAACSLHPSKARRQIEKLAQEAVTASKEFQPVVFAEPLNLQVSFIETNMADVVTLLPGVIRKGACTVMYKAEKYNELYNMITLFLILAGSSKAQG